MEYFEYIDMILPHDIGLNRLNIIVYSNSEGLFHPTFLTNTADRFLHIVQIVGVFHSLAVLLLVFHHVLLE